jgi:hypothetical protein
MAPIWQQQVQLGQALRDVPYTEDVHPDYVQVDHSKSLERARSIIQYADNGNFHSGFRSLERVTD